METKRRHLQTICYIDSLIGFNPKFPLTLNISNPNHSLTVSTDLAFFRRLLFGILPLFDSKGSERKHQVRETVCNSKKVPQTVTVAVIQYALTTVTTCLNQTFH